MKPSWIVVLFVASVSIATSQSVTIETQPVTVRYYRLPDKPLDPSWDTYIIRPEIVPDDYTGVTPAIRDWIFQHISLEGYAMNRTQADIQLEIHIGPLTLPAETLKSRKTSAIDKDGREHVSHEFYYEVKYAIPLSCTIRGKEGQPVHEIGIFSLTDDQVYKTGYYKQDRELDAWWRSRKSTIMSEHKLERLKEGLTRLQSRLNSTHGFQRTEEQIRFETIGKKKHPDAAAYDDALRRLATAFSAMDADAPVAGVYQAAKESLAFYTTHLQGLDADDKEQSKLRHICLYNLATASFWLEDFEASLSYVRQMLADDPKDKDALKLSADITDLQTSLKQAGRMSRHRGGE